MTASATPYPPCGDCGAEEGQFHNHFPICDQEQCPFCLTQLLSCEHRNQPHKVRRKGRLRYYCFPILCARCGMQWPEFFSVPDATWQYVIPRTHWDAIVCRQCFDGLAEIAPPQKPQNVLRPSRDLDDATLRVQPLLL